VAARALTALFGDEGSVDPAMLVPEDYSEQLNSAYPTIEDYIGQTPLVRLQRLNPNPTNVILCKLEGNNPAGSVKDRPAISMINEAEARGDISPGDTLIEATSGNTGIALAMAAAIKGYRLKLIMPSNMTEERKTSMAAYGAELIEVGPGQMEAARDLALEMQARGEGTVLDQFANRDNPRGHYTGTGPELWEQTGGRITHFVSSMGTTGTIMGTSMYLKAKNPDVQIVGLQPKDGNIPGIRRWPKEYLPKIFEADRVDRVMDITQRESEEMMRAAAKTEGIFAGVSSGGALSAAIRLSAEVDNAVICVIVCDRGDRYLSSGLFAPSAGAEDPRPCGPEALWSAVARLGAHPGPQYILFTSDPDPEKGGEPWCPDCARCISAAREVVRDAGGTLLEVNVGPRPEWKDPDHPLRHDRTFKVGGIPTLVRWGARKEGGGAELARLSDVLEKAADPAEARRILQDFVGETRDLRVEE